MKTLLVKSMVGLGVLLCGCSLETDSPDPAGSAGSGTEARAAYGGRAADADVRQITSAATAPKVRVMTLNVWIENWSTRRAKLRSVIRSIDPDIIGLQEVNKDSWPDIEADFDDYVGKFWTRSLIGGEGLALLVRADRFERPSLWRENTVTKTDQFFKCGKSNHDRNIVFARAVDRATGHTWDIFNTHFPTQESGPCLQNFMAREVSDWVENYGDNIVVMGDFNTGWNSKGNMHEAMGTLLNTSSVKLVDTLYKYAGPFGADDSIITKNGNPKTLFGDYIDHVLAGPSFKVHRAEIDRRMFSGSTAVVCSGVTQTADGRERACKVGQAWVPTDDMTKYSDHWAVWADLEYID
jgi:endonuclease/exonuclease/phosphatase family metal-dependent hydrolase